MIKKETKKPVPRKKLGGRKPVYPWASLLVGDSFLVKDKPWFSAAAMVQSYNKTAKKKIKVTQRKVKEGIRVWRIK